MNKPAAVGESVASRIALHVHRHYSKHFSDVDLSDEEDADLMHSVHVEVLTEEIAAMLAANPSPDGWIATEQPNTDEVIRTVSQYIGLSESQTNRLAGCLEVLSLRLVPSPTVQQQEEKVKG